jgi:hypothetical protein
MVNPQRSWTLGAFALGSFREGGAAAGRAALDSLLGINY